ncbi:MAG: ABC transporter ATP-binding protein [Pseudomonadota bacterium]
MVAVTLLQTSGLTKRYDGLVAIDNVDFRLDEGEVRALIGPNGAGKTTFVGMLSGRIKPSAGQVFFKGGDVTNAPAHRRIQMGMGYTFQVTSIFARLTMLENAKLAVNGDADKAIAALEEVGLAARANTLAGEQSYGHQRLLELAMGIAPQPSLLILDEPTQGFDAHEIASFLDLMARVRERSTVLLIEHNIAVVMAVADKITVLNFGEILAEGSPDEIQANPDVQAAYLGTEQ